jgi:hypothetical protein
MKTLVHVSSDLAYYNFETAITKRISTPVNGPIFTTNAVGMWDAYLDNLPSDRQHYNCKNCERFITKYGGLVTMTPEGFVVPLLWHRDDFPIWFSASVAEMWAIVKSAKVTGVLVNDEKVWGNPKTGEWTHLSGCPATVYEGKLKTAHQIMADKLQDFGILKHGLADFKIEVAQQAVRVLEADALDRSEKTLGVAKWFLALHEKLRDVKGSRRDNIIWLAVATAPVGWCHVRSSMISTLLDDLVQGLGYEEIAARWAKKMHPLAYMRPTAPASDGAIAQANKIIAKMEGEGSLARRFAKLDEVTAFWRPQADPAKEAPKPQGGVFDHLKTKQNPCAEIQLPAQTLTWVRFLNEVLDKAFKIEFLAPAYGAYFGLVTAVNLDAPPLLQWDTDPRNPVSWFFFHGGSACSKWNLEPGWVNVNAMCAKPCHWHHPEKFTKDGEAIFMVLEGCHLRVEQPGGNFFPESLRQEYHEIRRVMEHYSNKAVIAGHLEGTANGFALQKGDTFNAQVRVNGKDLYKIDRWH